MPRPAGPNHFSVRMERPSKIDSERRSLLSHEWLEHCGTCCVMVSAQQEEPLEVCSDISLHRAAVHLTVFCKEYAEH